MATYWRGTQKFKNIEIIDGGSVKGLYGYPESGGKVFYVNGGSDGNIDDSGDGLTVATSKCTIAAALALCTANKNDVIYVLNYGGHGRGHESFPIEVAVDQVHIIGVGHKANKWATVTADATDGANSDAFHVTGSRVEIAGLEIGGTAAGSGSGIVIESDAWGCYIHDCWFGIADGVGAKGVTVPSGHDAPFLRIEDCEFGAGLTTGAITIAGNATRGTIANNLFTLCPYAILVSGSAVGIRILNNSIYMDGNTAADGISLAAGTSACWADGNHAGYAKGDPTANYAFVDASSSNGWGINYSGITADNPN